MVRSLVGNGYRCACCRALEAQEIRYASLGEALSCIPIDLLGSGVPFRDTSEVLEIKVYSDEPVESPPVAWEESLPVAWAELSFPVCPRDRGMKYRATRWSGYRPDVGSFETIYNASREVLAMSWSDVLTSLLGSASPEAL